MQVDIDTQRNTCHYSTNLPSFLRSRANRSFHLRIFMNLIYPGLLLMFLGSTATRLTWSGYQLMLPHGPHGSQHSTETRQGNSCQADPSDLSFHKKSAHKPWKIDMLNPKMEVWFRWFLGYMLILRGVTGLIGKQDRHVFLLSNNLGTSRMVVIHNFCAIYERNP